MVGVGSTTTPKRPQRSLRGNNSSSNGGSSSSICSIQNLLSHALIGIFCMYVGLLIGMTGEMSSTTTTATKTETTATTPVDCSACPAGSTSLSSSSYSSTNSAASALYERSRRRQEQMVSGSTTSRSNTTLTTSTGRPRPFPVSLDKMFIDYATVPRDEFTKLIDIGVPLDPTTADTEDVMILYTSEKGLPTGKSIKDNKLSLGAEQAVENCHTVKVILQEPSTRRRKTQQCFAIVPQWESYALHKYMRLPKNVDSMAKNSRNAPELNNLENPLRYVSRSYDDRGRHAGVPVDRHIKPSYEVLVDYLQNLDRVLKELKPFLKVVMGKANAIHGKKNGGNQPYRSKNTIVVLVCNKGQAPLFRNFVCNARAKNFDLSHIVMFATDLETKRLCEELDIAVWYEESIFGNMPESAARSYGDRVFTKMMLAKVYCVHLVLSCGYNVVFQDVDVVWFKDPLPFLDSPELDEFDMIFQDDGARTIRYQPYSPNTGFYYVRYTPVTLFFFSLLLRMGDVIMLNKSHQAALTGLVNEFVSWKGLRVKVFRWGSDNPFPGGVEFHRGKQYMQNFFKKNFEEQVDPYIFHMSWTTNKDNKLKFFQQMGEWYTSSVAGIEIKNGTCTGMDCCLAKPELTCHYKDKPSKVPCLDSPNIDKGRKAFWS